MITTRKLSNALGAEIKGVDLSAPLSPGTIEEVRRIWLEHNVILFRGNDLTPEQQVRFTDALGEAEPNDSVAHLRLPGHPDIVLVSNEKRENGKKYDRTGQMWHTDHAFIANPTMASVLYAVQLPDVGGDTMFANMYLAYDALSDGMKAMLEPLEAVHDREHGARQLYRDRVSTTLTPGQTPPAVHRVVQVHPETGRKSLYVSEMFTTRFVGMTEEESRPLLEYLFQHSVQPQFTYRHQWMTGDLIVWDNRCTMHQALTDYDNNKTRRLRRTCVLGAKTGRYEDEGDEAKVRAIA
jgi:taurine dioxygenase